MERENTSPASAAALPDAGTERTRLLFATIALFLVASGICSFFIFATIDKFYSRTIVDQYVYLGEEIREDIQRHVCQGAGSGRGSGCSAQLLTENRVRLDMLLDELSYRAAKLAGKAHRVPTAIHEVRAHLTASLVSRDGTVLGTTDSSRQENTHYKVSNLLKASGSAKYLLDRGQYFILIPLKGGAGDDIADLVMRIPEQTLKSATAELLDRHETVIFIVLLAGVGLLTLALGLTVPAKLRSDKLPTKRTTAILLTVVCAAQIASFAGASAVFRENYQQLHDERTRSLAHAFRAHIEKRLDYSGGIDQLAADSDSDPGSRVGTMNHGSDFAGPFEILGTDGHTVLNAYFRDGVLIPARAEEEMKPSVLEGSNSPPSKVLLDLHKDKKTVGFLSLQMDRREVSKKLFSLAVEALIAVVISLLCLVELLLLVFRYLEKRIKRHAPKTPVHYGVMRPVIFLFLFGIDLSAALIPLQMERLYQPMFGLPKDLVLGLPVSAMFLMVGVTFLIAGAWMDRRGWHEPFVVGVLLTGASKFYAWLAPDAFQFVLAMAGIGFGYGLALMAAQGFVMANTSEEKKAHGISFFFAGVYAGSIGGTAIGAMLAERIGYDVVFLLGSLFVFACFACSLFFLRPTFVRPQLKVCPRASGEKTKSGVLTFLLDRNVLTLILFCSIPSAVAVIGFLNYFSPVYLSRLGISESIIGGVLTLYGISMVYVSPLIGAKIDKTDRKELFIVIGCVLGGCAFLGFHVLTGLSATIVAIILLGLSMSCLQASQTTYTLRLKATKRFGDGKAVAIVRASSRVGQMLGPMVFSGLVIAENTERAMTFFGLGYLVLAVLFMTLSRREKPAEVSADGNQVLPEASELKA